MPRRIALLPFTISALMVSAAAHGQATTPRAPDAVLTAVRNQVSLEGPETRAAREGDALRWGYRVHTGEGATAEITFNDGTRVQLSERSLLLIAGEDARPDHPKISDTTLLRGRLQVRIDAQQPGRPPAIVVVATPNAHVRMGPGEGVLEFTEEKGTRAEVREGQWRVRARGQQVTVAAGFASRVPPGDAPAGPEALAQAGQTAVDQTAVGSPAAPPQENARPAGLPDRIEERLREMDREIRDLKARLAQTPQPPQPSNPPPAIPSWVQAPEASSGEPFAWGDFTWLNGGSRQATRLIDTKYFTPQFDVDTNYTYSFNNPIDNTIVGSTATMRHNELNLAFLGFGGDVHIGPVRARLFTQFGSRSVAIPRNDLTPNHGQFALQDVYRYLSEAYAGYHWDKMHGINLDVGLFFSYVGLFSYTQFENWGYQASYTSDNTPWFFNGARLQLFPTDRLKVEIWLINGWQTYGKFNELPGVGYQLHYAPREWVKMVFNGYVGTDTQDHPGRVRFHSDNSLLMRYYNRGYSNGLSRAAFSLTADLGFEQGDGVVAFNGSGTEGNCTNATPCTQNFTSAMLYNMLWFWKNRISWMQGGGVMNNPGRYLVLGPTGVAAQTFDTNPGTTFFGWDLSTNVSWFATDNLTFRAEVSYHHSSVPYYAGHGGVTGPDGYKCGGLSNPDNAINTCAPPGWTPDLVNSETKLILAILFRL